MRKRNISISFLEHVLNYRSSIMTDEAPAPPAEEAEPESAPPEIEIPAPAEAPQQPAAEPVVESPAPTVPNEPNTSLEVATPLDVPAEPTPSIEAEPIPATHNDAVSPQGENQPESSQSSSPSSPTQSTTPPPPPPPQTPVSNPPPETSIASRRMAALEKRRANKAERLEKIVALARERGKITNNDVQILLGVSDATASRYLRELAVHGRLTRVGKQKRPVYEPV